MPAHCERHAAVPAEIGVNTYEHITKLWRELGLLGSGIMPARITLEFPDPDEVRECGTDLRDLAKKVDALFAAYGGYVKSAAGVTVDPDCFTEVLFKAIDGEALHELECAADDLAMDYAEEECA